MEYPGAHLTKPIRRAIVIVFMATFFITAPVAVMYTTGYRYDWNTGIIRETGSLSIDVLPAKAKVFLDGLELEQKIPIRLKNITPKKYHVKITLPGFYDWEKEITVERKQTTYIKDVQLIKKTTPNELVAGTIHDLSISPNGNYLTYTTVVNERKNLILYSAQENKTTAIRTFTSTSTINTYWSSRHNYFAATENEKPKTITIVNAENPSDQKTITNEPEEMLHRVIWRDSSEPTLYFGTTSTIASYYPRLRDERPFSSGLYHDWYGANGTLWSAEHITSTTELVISKDGLSFNNVFANLTTSTITSPKYYYFDKANNDHVLLRHINGSSMVLLHNGKQTKLETNHAHVSPFNNWWLLWNDAELWTYVEGEEPHLLYRSGNTLTSVTPIDKNNTLAIQLANEVKVLFPYHYIQQTILSVATDELVADPIGRILYYTTENGLYSLSY